MAADDRLRPSAPHRAGIQNMRIFQYWNTGDPPEDVSACIRSVRAANPDFEHQLFDRQSAAWFIGKRLGEREKNAFLALAVPAMQADYFRLCALWARGGVWIDADSRAQRPLGSLLAAAPGGYISMWNGRLQNHVIAAGQHHCPFLRASVELATRQIDRRLDGTAYHITGPRVLNLVWAVIDPEGRHEDPHLRRNSDVPRTEEAESVVALCPGAAEAFAKMERRHDFWTAQWLTEVEDAAYKATPQDWRKWSDDIYFPNGNISKAGA